MYNFNPTCAMSGSTKNLHMHAIRNSEYDMIGWIFINENQPTNRLRVTVEILPETESDNSIMSLLPAKIDNL